MHLSNTLLKRWPASLLALVVLAVLSFAVTATGESTAKPRPLKTSPTRSADPPAPAGPRGPIRLDCMTGRAGIVVTDGPAGPQGPVGVNCAAAQQG